jgi:hypothetical protein
MRYFQIHIIHIIPSSAAYDPQIKECVYPKRENIGRNKTKILTGDLKYKSYISQATPIFKKSGIISLRMIEQYQNLYWLGY